MRGQITVLATVFALAMPAVALASEGILLLAPNGGPEWNAQVKELAAKVDALKPADVAFGSPTHSTIAVAVERLAKRGVTAGRSIVIVPLMMANDLHPSMAQTLEGFSYEMSKRGIMSDGRWVQWLTAQKPAAAR